MEGQQPNESGKGERQRETEERAGRDGAQLCPVCLVPEIQVPYLLFFYNPLDEGKAIGTT